MIKSLYKITIMFVLLLVDVTYVHGDNAYPDGVILGRGTRLVQVRDLVFGTSREKKFCAGEEVSNVHHSQDSLCCTIFISASTLDLPEDQSVVLSAQERRVVYQERSFFEWSGQFIFISSPSIEGPVVIRCDDDDYITDIRMDNTFNGIFEIMNIVEGELRVFNH